MRLELKQSKYPKLIPGRQIVIESNRNRAVSKKDYFYRPMKWAYTRSAMMTKSFLIRFFLPVLFLSTATILQGQSYITASLNSPGGAGIMSENCDGPYELVIRRVPGNQDSMFIFVSGSGVAVIGVDYSFQPGSLPVEMLPSDTVAIIPVIIVNDGLSEGLETVNWEIAFLAGEFSDFITFETAIVDAYDVDIQTPTDTIVWCRNVPYVLLATTNAEEIFWSPASSFDDSLGTAATVRPVESGWYYASVGNEACGAKDSVYFDLAIVDIESDTVFICAGGPGIMLNGSIEGLATDFTWIPADGTLSDPDILNPVATPEVTTTYLLQSDIGVCRATDRVVVRVDSIPDDLHISIAPEKPYYCDGEMVALFSPTYDSVAYPDLTFKWTPNDGTITSDLTLLNAALTLRDTTLYIRENINNACMSSDSIRILVVPSSIPLSVMDTMLCPGEQFTVTVLSDQVMEPEWTPTEGLSCSQCLSPVVTVIGIPGTQYSYQFSGKIEECPVGSSLTIRVPDVQEINISGDQVVCEGEQIQLMIANPEGLSNFNWTFTSGIATFSCDNCPDPLVTINSFNSNDTISITVTADTEGTTFCGAFGTFDFTEGVHPQINSAIFGCLGETVTATTGNASFTDVIWNVMNGDVSLSCTECPNPEVTIGTGGQIHFFAEVSGPDTCRVSGVVNISIFPRDQNFFMFEPDSTEIGQGTDVMVGVFGTITPATINWTVNGNSISSTGNPIEFTASEEVNFIVAEYINSKGCEQTDTISLATVPPRYMIPNAFTPDNGDEINDHFKVILVGNIQLDELLVFNRWGQLVFESPENDLTGWDGRINNEPAPSDTYVYTAKLRLPDGRTELAKGDVILLR